MRTTRLGPGGNPTARPSTKARGYLGARPTAQTVQPHLSGAGSPAALAHYSALGFSTIAYEEGDEYGFANRDGIGLHLARDHHPGDQHHRHCASTYLYVRDADAIYEEWTRPGIGGQTEAVHATPYKLREGSHTDPDGNLIRFGSPTDE